MIFENINKKHFFFRNVINFKIVFLSLDVEYEFVLPFKHIFPIVNKIIVNIEKYILLWHVFCMTYTPRVQFTLKSVILLFLGPAISVPYSDLTYITKIKVKIL